MRKQARRRVRVVKRVSDGFPSRGTQTVAVVKRVSDGFPAIFLKLKSNQDIQ